MHRLTLAEEYGSGNELLKKAEALNIGCLDVKSDSIQFSRDEIHRCIFGIGFFRFCTSARAKPIEFAGCNNPVAD